MLNRLLAVTFAGFFNFSLAHAGPADFHTPEPVTIKGYSDHAMEPFISRSGKFLFFNNSNDPAELTDLHYARRLSDTEFKYMGPMQGVNSGMLDGVPSMDGNGELFFISTRSYDETLNTLWRGWFAGAEIVDVTPLRSNVSTGKKRWFNMDAEISADGSTLYFTDNQWARFKGRPKSSDLSFAKRSSDGAFRRSSESENVFSNINSKLLEYAPSTSADELTLYFTRLNWKKMPKKVNEALGTYVSTRPDKSAPFGIPQKIEAITGFAEAPSVAPDGCAIYFHKKVGEKFRIHRAKKKDCN